MLIINGITYTDVATKLFIPQSAQMTDEFVPEIIPIAGNGGPEINSIQIRNDQILKIMKSLNVNKACGIDGIGNNVLKSCAESLAEPIELLANASLNSGCFPSAWKKSNVIPIFKKGEETSVSNYRPISLLSCTSKIIERVVFNELYDYGMKSNLWS